MSANYYKVSFDDVTGIFKLDTRNTSYCLGIVYEEGYLGHFYYGEKINDHNLSGLIRINEYPFGKDGIERERCSFHDMFAHEFPTHGFVGIRGNVFGDYSDSLQAKERRQSD